MGGSSTGSVSHSPSLKTTSVNINAKLYFSHKMVQLQKLSLIFTS